MNDSAFDPQHNNASPERRYGDEHMRKVVHLTVQEIFDGVGVDLSTPKGRQQFRDNIGFLDDARSGTGLVRKTFLGLFATGVLFGVWKFIVFLATWKQ